MNEDIEYKGAITYDVFEAAQYLFNGYRWLFLLIPPGLAGMAGFILCRSYLEWFILIAAEGDVVHLFTYSSGRGGRSSLVHLL